MPEGITKRIVVLKDIKSNIIEEAILILRNESGAETCSGKKTHPIRSIKDDPDYIVKEARIIIEDFMKENELKISSKKGKGKRLGFLKSRLMTEIIINAALIASILLLIFIASKII